MFLECSNFAQDDFDILTLLLQNAAALLQHLLLPLDLGAPVLGGVIHVNQLPDFGQ